MRLRLLIIALLLCSSAATAEIYKWVDKNGTMHFSDQPQPGSTELTIPPQTLKEGVPATSTQPTNTVMDTRQTGAAQTDDSKQNPAEPVKQHVYSELSIQDPIDQGTVRDNNGTINITVKMEPALFSGDKFQVLLDGAPFGEPQTTMPLKITGVDRGEHKLAVEIQDKEGKALRSSGTITIYLHKATVKQ